MIQYPLISIMPCLSKNQMCFCCQNLTAEQMGLRMCTPISGVPAFLHPPSTVNVEFHLLKKKKKTLPLMLETIQSHDNISKQIMFNISSHFNSIENQSLTNFPNAVLFSC